MAGHTGHKATQNHARGSIAIPSAMALCGLGLVGFLQFLPAQSDRDVMAVFAPHISFDEAAARVNAAGAEVLNAGFAGNMVTARLRENTNPQSLKDVGAWLILSAATPDLCTAGGWSGSQRATTTDL